MFPHHHLQVHRERSKSEKTAVSSWETPPEVHENGHLSADKSNSLSSVHTLKLEADGLQQPTPGATSVS